MSDPNPSSERLIKIAGGIADFDLEKLIHPPQGGTYNFEPNRSFLEFTLSFYKEISSADWDNIPPPVLDTIFNHATNILNALSSIQSFNYKLNDPNQVSSSLIQNLQNQWREAYLYAAPHVAFAKVSSSVVSQEMQTIKAVFNQMQFDWAKKLEEYTAKNEITEKRVSDKISEFENVITATREASGKEAVSRQSLEFEQEAEKCLNASRWWFGATISAVIISLIVVYEMFLKTAQSNQILQSKFVPTNQLSPISTNAVEASKETLIQAHFITPELLQQTVARILIVTLLYSAVVWFARNYFASRHNYTVNRHRRNAMQTFRAFVEGTKDTATQDFILRQAAACAFSPQQSGYLKDECLPTPATSTPIIDFVRPPN